MKKLCSNCIHYKLEDARGYLPAERCTYVISDSCHDYVSNDTRHPIPSIHNATNECPYYTESWLSKTLRRMKND